MGIKQAIEGLMGWIAENGVHILIALAAIAVGALIYWALPRAAEAKFSKSDAGIILRVQKVERDQKELAKLFKKSRGSWPYTFINADKKQAAAEDYTRLSDHINRENAEIDAKLGIALSGEDL